MRKISIAPSIQEYQPIISDSHKHAALIKEKGLDAKFEAISIGNECGQIAIVPLDESSSGNAERIVLAWNNHSRLVEELQFEKAESRNKNVLILMLAILIVAETIFLTHYIITH